ncbi:hypothetical protein [Scytonema hofmannii]|uniref:hypothetical protein n=1 Tax=Scytonema hofmannii TaxID=34078 RepID=UPI0030104444
MLRDQREALRLNYVAVRARRVRLPVRVASRRKGHCALFNRTSRNTKRVLHSHLFQHLDHRRSYRDRGRLQAARGRQGIQRAI